MEAWTTILLTMHTAQMSGHLWGDSKKYSLRCGIFPEWKWFHPNVVHSLIIDTFKEDICTYCGSPWTSLSKVKLQRKLQILTSLVSHNEQWWSRGENFCRRGGWAWQQMGLKVLKGRRMWEGHLCIPSVHMCGVNIPQHFNSCSVGLCVYVHCVYVHCTHTALYKKAQHFNLQNLLDCIFLSFSQAAILLWI